MPTPVLSFIAQAHGHCQESTPATGICHGYRLPCTRTARRHSGRTNVRCTYHANIIGAVTDAKRDSAGKTLHHVCHLLKSRKAPE
jgi:hypothetical protein